MPAPPPAQRRPIERRTSETYSLPFLDDLPFFPRAAGNAALLSKTHLNLAVHRNYTEREGPTPDPFDHILHQQRKMPLLQSSVASVEESYLRLYPLLYHSYLEYDTCQKEEISVTWTVSLLLSLFTAFITFLMTLPVYDDLGGL